MIRMSLEVPSAYLQWWSPFCDMDFVLAHKVLEDKTYAGYFASRPTSRELLMDNSLHELGHPLPIADLLEAARRCKADTIIAPDKLGEPEWNEKSFQETLTTIGGEFSVGVSMAGRSSAERKNYLRNVSSASMLLLPYREDRLMWYHENKATILRQWKRIHLLGVNELSELRSFVEIARETPLIDWSVDTGKCVKHGVELRRIDDNAGTLRGAKLASSDLLNLDNLTEAQVRAVEQNIRILKSVCTA
jgi:hypothetical protein